MIKHHKNNRFRKLKPNWLYLGQICKKVELTYSGARISSDGGLLLLREVDNQLGLMEAISNCIIDTRDQRYIAHTVKEMLTQRVYQIAAGL